MTSTKSQRQRAEELARKHILPIDGLYCSCGYMVDAVTEGLKTCQQLVHEIAAVLLDQTQLMREGIAQAIRQEGRG